MKDIPPIRETDSTLEIDAKRGEWPHIRFMRAEDGSGKLFVMIDANMGGMVVGEGKYIAPIVLSKKKARRILEFLDRTDG